VLIYYSRSLACGTCSPFGSHVLEKLLLQVAAVLSAGEEADQALGIVTHMVELLKEDLLDYITHKFATFFARRLLQLLTGQLGAATVSSGITTVKKVEMADKIRLIHERSGKSSLPGLNAAPASHNSYPFEEQLVQHLRTLVQEVCGHGVNPETLYSLQKSTFAGPFLQALLASVKEPYVPATPKPQSQLLPAAWKAGPEQQCSSCCNEFLSQLVWFTHVLPSIPPQALLLLSPSCAVL
jgi:hypothetical protein